MRKFILSVGIILTSFGLVIGSEAAQVGNWNVNYWPGENGPNGCIMEGSYKSGTIFSIGVTSNYNWGIMLSNPNWNLKKNEKIEMQLAVDGIPIESPTANATDKNSVTIPLKNPSAFKALQVGRNLVISNVYGKYPFVLEGTERAMNSLLDCMKTQKEATNKPAAPKTPTQKERSTSFSMVQPSEATVILTNMLNSAGVRGYKLLPPQSEDKGISLVFEDGGNGYFVASRGSDTPSADDYSSEIINIISKTCKGDFVSGKQVVPSTDGSVIRKVATTCRSADSTSAIDSTVVRKSNGFLFWLSRGYEGSTNSLAAGPSEQAVKQQTGIVEAAMRSDSLR